ncbi:MAG: hypothetical protein CMC19_03820 [Flavobacteriaceae bacterium]|nr:hypothetical protein [Flavobacteriaceae bacterium]OUX39998.1 MAG: hypothetical protein CBE25_02080 [Flavobacteriaceae bacterium TMED265]
MYAIILAALLSFQTSTVQGTWVNIDDETGVEKSEITLYVENGKLYGKIERLLLPEDQGKVCEKCKGKEKNQPIEGLIIVKGLAKDGEVWTDGKILDPANGKSYDCAIKLDDSNTLNVRGYLGFSFIGRSQVWKRKA